MSKFGKRRAAQRVQEAVAPPILEPPVSARGVVTRLARGADLLDLSAVRLDGGTQPRVALDGEALEEYAARMRHDEDLGTILDPDGEAWAPLIVFDDGEDQWLADGFHRVHAARAAGLTRFPAQIRVGTRRDAVLFSFGVNATHGKRRTNADKRRAVERMLRDEEWSGFTDKHIARVCKVSQPFVSKMRRGLVASSEITERAVRIGQDGSVVPVAALQRAKKKRASTRVTRPHVFVLQNDVPDAPVSKLIGDALDAQPGTHPSSIVVVFGGALRLDTPTVPSLQSVPPALLRLDSGEVVWVWTPHALDAPARADVVSLIAHLERAETRRL